MHNFMQNAELESKKEAVITQIQPTIDQLAIKEKGSFVFWRQNLSSYPQDSFFSGLLAKIEAHSAQFASILRELHAKLREADAQVKAVLCCARRCPVLSGNIIHPFEYQKVGGVSSERVKLGEELQYIILARRAMVSNSRIYSHFSVLLLHLDFCRN